MKKIFIVLSSVLLINSAFAININSDFGKSALNISVKECVNAALNENGYKLFGMLFNQEERKMYTKLCTCAMKRTLSKMTVEELITIGTEDSSELEAEYEKLGEYNMIECIKEYSE